MPSGDLVHLHQRWLTVALCVVAGCAEPSKPVAEQPSSALPPRPSATSADAGADASTREASPDAAAPAAAASEPVVFPPPPIPPPSPRSAKPGDGTWTPIGDSTKSEPAAVEPRLLYKTVVRPHPISHWKSVNVVAIDLTRAALALVEGTDEPESKDVPKAERRGLVPAEDHAHLLATFNGGWQAKHGRWGMMLDGKVFLPAKPEGCTIAIYRDRSVRVGVWPALAPTEREMRAYRQTPPCLVESGAIHPKLLANEDSAWGGHDPKIQTRHRSAIGVDAKGRVLFYAIGEETTPRELAQGLLAAGAASAAELDINFGWMKFLVFGRPTPEAPLQVTSTLLPKMLHRKLGHVAKGEPRDFFYVKRLQK